MHTQNINGAAEASRIWAENHIEQAINNQKKMLARLVEIKNEQLSEKDEAEQVLGTLMLMADIVLFPGITNWSEYRPRVQFSVAQPWIEARAVAKKLFGETGEDFWMRARVHIADCIEMERHY